MSFEIRKQFIDSFNILAVDIHKTAKEKGWWDGEKNTGEAIALMHSELSEALEGDREGNPIDDKIPFDSMSAEFADTIIRIMDFGHAKGLRVAEAVVAKMEMNRTRKYKHGGKKY